MFFLYLKSNGEISPPLRKGEPDLRTLNKEANCGIGSGIKWENVDLFYAPDEDFGEVCDFCKWAAAGKYYIENNEIKERFGWQEPESFEEEP